jgi:signal transduction histidine kinase
VGRQTAAAAGKGVGLELHRVATADVVGDPDLLGRLVDNLLDNAIRHTPPGGTVAVTLERAGGKAAVAVCDTGEGIPPEDLPHVFDRFYRVDRARARATGGTGLGLAIAQQIAQLHGGELRVDSHERQGTVFTLELPLAPAPGASS